jgi:hypothetical protein
MLSFKERMGAAGVILLCAGAGCGDDAGAGGGPAGGGSITVQISGEDLATDGFGFPDGSEVVIADGWEISFDHVFVTVGRVWLAENPDVAPSDQSRTGEVVAEVTGPWAVDLAKPGEVPGAGGEGTAIKLFDIDKMNKRGDEPFAADQRYAFSYSTVNASAGATKVNFANDAVASALYDALAAQGCTVAYVGTATFRGDATCAVSDATYDFTAVPTTVPFTLCFNTPTEYLNCQNQENQGDPFPDEEYQRGIPIKDNQATLAQLTFHLEHPFYSDVEHEPVLYFDQLAAQLAGAPPGSELTLDALTGLDPTAFTDGAGQDLPWRRCDGGDLPAGTQRSFEAGSIPIGPGQDPSSGFRDYGDYVRYVQSSQGHLNGGEGICYTRRSYPSPQ